MTVIATSTLRHSGVTGEPYRGFATLLRLQLRRDRGLLIAWVLTLAALPTLIVSATRSAYPSQTELAQFAAQAEASPTQLATRGHVFDVSVGGLTAWTVISSSSIIMGIVGILLTVRHTRADEQAGRTELVGARPVGRLAQVSVAIAIPTLACLAISVLAAAGLLLQGLPTTGSLLLGMIIGASGLVFVGIGAVAGQLAESASGARAIGIVSVGTSFALAAVGDLGGSWLVWLTPVGWARHAEAFAGNHGWVVALPLVAATLMIGWAIFLARQRDLGAGVLPARPGAAHARPWLRNPLALGWRRQRGAMIGWVAGLGLLGLLLGSVTQGLDAQLDTEAFRKISAGMGGGDVSTVFFQFMVYVLAQVATAAALVTALQLRHDESDGLAEAILVRGVPRWRWALGQMIMAAIVGVGTLTAIGITAGLTSGDLLGLIGTTWAYVPAALTVIGAAAALVGWAPRIAVSLSWGLFLILIAMDLLGEFGLVSDSVMMFSPYALTFGGLLGQHPLALPVVLLSLLAVALTALGLIGHRRRDLTT